ncbi:MAG: tripartite tricarboxylate transporter substrate binding protein [Acetobacteraceae bacterium]|nr:tripartite tricarboxylate transporter substrate binding protein [Acetobacteraceae bacterium]
MLAGGGAARPARAQQAGGASTFPDRPVRLIVPYPPGGPTDLVMRAFAEAAQKPLGQPIVVENRSGAAGTMGAQLLATGTRPDGYTIAQMPISVLRHRFLSARPIYNPRTDFTWIIQLAGYQFGVLVRADAPWKTFQEFLDYAKANPGKVEYGSPGVGSSLHITMTQIAEMKGIEWLHVPFRGTAASTNAVLAGQIAAVASSIDAGLAGPGGALRALVSWGAQRHRSFPEVPTLRDVGIDLVSESPYGIAGPRGMDPAVVRVLHDAFKAAMDDPAVQALLERYDMPALYLNSEDYTRWVLSQIETEERLAARLGLRGE